MKIISSAKSKMIKKREKRKKRKKNRKRKRQKFAIFRELMNNPQLTNRKIREKLRKWTDENSLDEKANLLLLLKDQIETQKKQPDKQWYFKKKRQNCSELF
jgi:hypothetical protein